MKYQLNPLLKEITLPELLVTSGITGLAGTGVGAGVGHIASKFGDSDLDEEEKAERAKKFRRRGAAIGGTIGFAAPIVAVSPAIYKAIKHKN